MRFLLAGDSTVAECEPNDSGMSGWGARLAAHVDTDDRVLNFAKGGATTLSFRAEGLWDALVAEIGDGDTVLIQFGHNDQKQPELLAAESGYRERLIEFVAEARAAGGSPILCTSVERRLFDDDGEGHRIRYSHGGYPAAVRRIASELDVPLVDLTVFTTWLYESSGPDASAELFTPADNTHFHERGADAVAAFVALTLRAILRRDDALVALGRNP